jgi:hypothetical protein
VWLGEDADDSELLVPYVDSYINERNRKVDWDEISMTTTNALKQSPKPDTAFYSGLTGIASE